MISLENVSKRIGYKSILRHINFEIYPGELIGITGPNGAGKTTLLRILATLSSTSEGKVRIGSCILPGHAALARRLISYVGHQSILYGDLTASENLNFFTALYGKKLTQAEIEQNLERVGLVEHRHEIVSTFSRGMQQRLNLAVAISRQAQVYLLDEPFQGLDENGCVFLDETLRSIHTEGGTILLVSHDMQRLEALCDRILFMNHGCAEWRAAPDKVFNFPQEPQS
jgi:heme exporter protein A